MKKAELLERKDSRLSISDDSGMPRGFELQYPQQMPDGNSYDVRLRGRVCKDENGFWEVNDCYSTHGGAARIVSERLRMNSEKWQINNWINGELIQQYNI